MTLLPRSLRGKLMALIVGVSLIVLGVGSVLIARDRVVSLEHELLATAEAVATSAGEYTVSSLAFDDRDDATKALGQLAAIAGVEAAALYDTQGTLFATYYRRPQIIKHAPLAERIDPRSAPATSLDDQRVEISLPIIHAGVRRGTIYVRTSAGPLAARVEAMYGTLVVALIGLLLLAIVAGWLLQRIVTRPIAHLAAIADRVAAGDERRIDLSQIGTDELGTLARALDTMLERLDANTRSLKESHETIAALIDAAPLAILAVDANCRVTAWNAQAERIFGRRADAVLGGKLAETLPAPALAAIWERCHDGQEVTDAAATLEREDGSACDLVISCAPLTGATQRGGALILVSDVTERRQAERALGERERQLQRAQQLELVGRLSGGLAHDFNNLLTVILTCASLIERRGRSDPEVAELAHGVVEAAQRGSVLTRRLLGFSKQWVHEVSVVDVNQAIESLRRMIASAIGESIDLRLELASQPVTIQADAGQLEQVLLNLVMNARDAMHQGGVLTIRTRTTELGPRDETSEEGWTVIEITDTGVGMSSEVLSRATDAFYTTKAHGTGLGLSTAVAIVRAFRGELSLSSTQGEGTTASVWLRRTAAPRGAAIAPSTRAIRTGRETVLLVEDEPAIRSSLRTILEDAGYQVRDAGSGAEALAVYRDGPAIDIVVTDVVMRGMTGPELVQQLTRDMPRLPVLYMSGYAGEALQGHGLGEETTLLQKPFSPDVLLRRLRELLDARASSLPFTASG